MRFLDSHNFFVNNHFHFASCIAGPGDVAQFASSTVTDAARSTSVRADRPNRPAIVADEAGDQKLSGIVELLIAPLDSVSDNPA